MSRIDTVFDLCIINLTLILYEDSRKLKIFCLKRYAIVLWLICTPIISYIFSMVDHTQERAILEFPSPHLVHCGLQIKPINNSLLWVLGLRNCCCKVPDLKGIIQDFIVCMFLMLPTHCSFNNSPPSGAYMHQGIRVALVQKMACRLFGAKPLSKPMLGYCDLDP